MNIRRIDFYLRRLRERLWAKPALFCAAAVVSVFAARTVDSWWDWDLLPDISFDMIEKLLTIISSSMLAVATFAVASMLSAYSAAASSATPRAFKLVVADDMSQNALSSFIGAFIFSIIAIIALKSGYYGENGLFFLFILTLSIFGWVVLTFVRWVDSVARLGELGSTVEKVESATKDALSQRQKMTTTVSDEVHAEMIKDADVIYSPDIGYVQHIEISALQEVAKKVDGKIVVEAMPGTFVTGNDPIAYLNAPTAIDGDAREAIADAYLIDRDRTFDNDPRFGFTTLAEIAARALSPGVNDPGTAVSILGHFVRLFYNWAARVDAPKAKNKYDRVLTPGLSVDGLFDDAFGPVARHGAGDFAVALAFMDAMQELARTGDERLRKAARKQASLMMKRAEIAHTLPEDLERLRALAKKVTLG
ncbi:DUF2254 domain-containing protein [Aliiroseovarius sp. YM-037]|uniref:DUF2254 domain-containing protein n=1 Tax=Aliiroseovarius sp. YM-037 TaxID=3341728 RepID=UPI003A8036B0